MNKLGANMQCISSAEKIYTRIQANGNASKSELEAEAISTKPPKTGAHIGLAAG
jgi:hypothetical protein